MYIAALIFWLVVLAAIGAAAVLYWRKVVPSDVARHQTNAQRAVELHPVVRAKTEEDRRYEALRFQQQMAYERQQAEIEKHREELALKRDEFVLKAWQTRTLISPEMYVMDHDPGQITALPSLKSAAPAQLPAPGANVTQIEPVLTFRELLATGRVQAALGQGQMLLGYANGQMRYGSWFDLYSCGIGGVSGSGKSTTVRFLLFQAILAAGKFVMIDPHIGEPEESLAAQFQAFKNIHALPPCDDDPAQVARRVRFVMKEYSRRKARGIKGPPIVFILDEFNELVRRLPDELRKELADLLLTISQGGRKFGIFAMLLAQRWSEQDLGGKNYGAAIRSSLASLLAHRFTDEDQAKKLIGGKHGARCLELPQGHYFFRDTQGTLSEMITPLTVESDGLHIQRILDGENTADFSENTEELDVSALSIEPLQLRDFKHENTNSETSENTDIHTLARQVMTLQAGGKGKADIMRQVWNVNPGASEEYKQALQQYQAVMQYIAERLEA